MRFTVRCVGAGEEAVRTEVVDAADEADVRRSLALQGLLVLRIQKQGTTSATGTRRQRAEYGILCRELRTLVRAGMTVVEAVDTLAIRTTASKHGPGLAQELRDRLLRGESFSQALAAMPFAPGVLVAAVRAGERTSNLADAFEDYLAFDDLVSGLRRKAGSAAVYPSLVAGLGIAIAVFLLMVVMPSFSRMYQNLRGRSGGLTSWIIDLSLWVSSNRALALAATAAVLMAAAYWIWSGAAARQLMQIAVSFTWTRTRIEDFQLSMLYQALALLLKGGYPMVQSMDIASQASLGSRIASGLRQAKQEVSEGRSVSAALVTAGLCDETGRRLMAAAERNGQFHAAAATVARLHGARFEQFVERVARVVEPMLLLIVAVGVGALVVAMYMPVFDMATRLR